MPADARATGNGAPLVLITRGIRPPVKSAEAAKDSSEKRGYISQNLPIAISLPPSLYSPII